MKIYFFLIYLKKKKVSNGTFIEFGAWDGVHYSNCKLFSDIEWKGFFIEGNIERFNKLLSNYKNYKNINCINKFIDENYNLDKFVEDNKVKNLGKNKNIVIGFGITEKTISSLKKADGLVVGSILCKKISNSIEKRQNPVTNVTNIVKKLKNKII